MTTTETIGIDLGGTKIEAIRHDGTRITASHRVPTEPEKGYATVLANIKRAVDAVRTPNVVALGLALPGSVHDGKLIGSGTLGAVLGGKKVAADLSKILGLPVRMENDAKLFALAEARLGAGKGKEHVIGLIIGTGVGAGIVTGGHILRGARGGAGEIGHAPYLDHDFEFFVAGPAYRRLYLAAGGTDTSVTAEQIITARRPDAAMAEAREKTLDATARLIATLVNTCNPEIITIGGGVSLSLDYKALTKRTEQYALPGLMDACDIVKHKISDSAGAIGAAMLARE